MSTDENDESRYYIRIVGHAEDQRIKERIMPHKLQRQMTLVDSNVPRLTHAQPGGGLLTFCGPRITILTHTSFTDKFTW